MNKHKAIIFLLFLGINQLMSQTSCFDLYMNQGRDALKIDSFQLAIQSFQAIRDCDHLSSTERKEARDSLDSAFYKNEKRQNAAKKLIIINEARRLAALANTKNNAITNLELAYFAKMLSDTIDTDIPEVEWAFRLAVKEYFKLPKSNISSLTFADNKELITAGTDTLAILPFGKDKFVVSLKDSSRIELLNVDRSLFKAQPEYSRAANIIVRSSMKIPTAPKSKVNIMVVAPQKDYIVSGNRKGELFLWNPTWANTKKLTEQTNVSYQIDFSDTGDNFFARSADKLLRLWNRDGTLIRALSHEGRITAATFVGDKIITTSIDKTVKIWDGQTGEILDTLLGHAAPIYYLNVSPNKEQFLTFDGERKGILWDIEGNRLADFPAKKNLVNIRFTACDKQWLYCYEKHFKLVSEQDTIAYPKQVKPIIGVVFSPERDYFLSWSQDSTAKLWNLKEKEPVIVINQNFGLTSEIKAGWFSPDSEQFMLQDRSGQLIICSIPAPKYIALKASFTIRPSTRKRFNILEDRDLRTLLPYIEKKEVSKETPCQLLIEKNLTENPKPKVKKEELLTKNATNNPPTTASQMTIPTDEIVPNENEENTIPIRSQNVELPKRATSNNTNRATIESQAENKMSTDQENKQYKIIVKTRLRIGPDQIYGVLAPLPLGKIVSIQKSDKNKDWWEVKYNGLVGYIKKRCVAPIDR